MNNPHHSWLHGNFLTPWISVITLCPFPWYFCALWFSKSQVFYSPLYSFLEGFQSPPSFPSHPIFLVQMSLRWNYFRTIVEYYTNKNLKIRCLSICMYCEIDRQWMQRDARKKNGPMYCIGTYLSKAPCIVLEPICLNDCIRILQGMPGSSSV